ncbi:MAG: hypothetical protein B0D92_04900 [Spirochaeta sp. LUC14_002_19_P3]|nr:MAG: hypothetical protein B0D92_04900 [Spirochaeta sp. LUC14_002_19_P3]
MYNSLLSDISHFPAQHISDFKSAEKAACCIVCALQEVRGLLCPGLSTSKLAGIVERRLAAEHADAGAIVTISPEETAWHGMPGNRLLHEGEIVSVDIACSVKGWWADMCATYPVGVVDEKRMRLLQAAQEATFRISTLLKDGYNGREGRAVINQICGEYQVTLIPDAAGHGIGRQLHCNPLLPYSGGTHLPLTAKHTCTIEPVFTTGCGTVIYSDDGSAVTADGEPAAHFELSVFIEHDSARILGQRGACTPF